MSCDKWAWTPICDTRPCPGDCDYCSYEDEYTIYAESGTVSVGGEDEHNNQKIPHNKKMTIR